MLYVEVNEDHTVGGSHQAQYDLVTRLDPDRWKPLVLFYQDNVFAERLRAEGHDVFVFDELRAKELAIRHTRGRLRKWIDFAAAVVRRVRFLRQERVDLVHLNNTPVLGWSDWLPAARLLGIPCITSIMAIPEPVASRLKRRIMSSFDRYLPDSHFIVDMWAMWGLPAERMQVIHHGVDIEALRGKVGRSPDSIRRELEVPPERLLVAMVGNIRPWKGQHVVLKALSILPSSVRSHLYVVFAGATAPQHQAYEDELLDTVERLGLRDCVRFLGERRDVPEIFNAADIAVHSSVEPEPFGIVILEALALGTPVIAAAAGGPSEILTPQCGLTFHTRHPDRLAEHLTTLVNDPELRRRLGRAAVGRSDQFALERNVREHEAVYRGLFERPTS